MGSSQYVALYRKYRPRSFKELVGQEAVARTLANAITQQRLAHAYLFTGPRGTGKTSVARILAKSINCAAGPTDEPCETCASCSEISQGNHLDVVEIDAASNNGVDNIRDLQDRVALAPVGGRFKIYIIDEVHMLSQGAFNALLKTLEEPPPRVIFILATTDPHKVLPTIISRCQRFDFGRIPLKLLVDRLAHVAQQEGIAIDAAGLEAIARRAQGGLRDALSLLDQMAAMAMGGAIATEEIASALGLLSGEQLASLGQALLEQDVPLALDVAQQLLAIGHDHGAIMRELMFHFRHLLVLQLSPERAVSLEVPPHQIEVLKAQSARVSGAELSWMLECLNETEGILRRSPQQGLWLELGLIKLAQRPSIPSLVELAERVAALEAALQGGASISVAASTKRPASPPPPATIARPQQGSPASPPPAASGGANSSDPQAPSELPKPRPDLGLPPRPPIQPPSPPPAVTAAQPESAPAPVVAGARPIPPGAWEKFREAVRQRSRPTAALLEPPTSLQRWEAEGAVIISATAAWRDLLEAPAKKKIIAEEVVRVFGAGSFPRFEVAAANKAVKRGATQPAPRPEFSRPEPVSAPTSPAFVPTPPPPVPQAANPVEPLHQSESFAPAPFDDDIPPPDEGPSAWLDEVEASTAPVPHSERVVSNPRSEPTNVHEEDNAVRLAVDLFNGKVMRGPGT